VYLASVPFYLVLTASTTFSRSTPYQRREEITLWATTAVWAVLLAVTWALGTVTGVLLVAVAVMVWVTAALAVVYRRRRLAEEAEAEV
jgi:hypothetical protein